jgi:hypothetical protein
MRRYCIKFPTDMELHINTTYCAKQTLYSQPKIRTVYISKLGHGPGFGPASTDGSPVHGSQYTTVPGPNSFTPLPPVTTSAGLPTYGEYPGLYSVPSEFILSSLIISL